eukprot:COSAG01_NODE_174_length_23022_cov_528.590978_9_plen_65_part_00
MAPADRPIATEEPARVRAARAAARVRQRRARRERGARAGLAQRRGGAVDRAVGVGAARPLPRRR